MFIGDLPYLIRQQAGKFVAQYRGSSLYHRNIGFFMFGITCGYVVGTVQRWRDTHSGVEGREVSITQYEIAEDAGNMSGAYGINSKSEKNTDTKAHGSLTSDSSLPSLRYTHEPTFDPIPSSPSANERRRMFEKQWSSLARYLQKFPGYSYTQMFREISMPINSVNVSDQDVDVADERSGVLNTARVGRGIGAGLSHQQLQERKINGSPQQVQEAIRREGNDGDRFIELRSWVDTPHQQRALSSEASAAANKTWKEGGIKMKKAQYITVFDDSIVRIIK